nr:PREDICTED: tubulin polyglutamylase TTLL4 isoform X2 [Equus przewalskii]
MASAGTEHYSLGLRRGSTFKQTGPSGTVPAPPPEKPSEGKVWSQAHQQVKPIWKLEKKHVGPLSPRLGPGLLGVPPQQAYFFCPSTLCSSGTTAVIAGHSSSCYLHSLPDLFSSTLLYRRSSNRHKPYQQLESFCLRSSPSEKRPFSLPQKSLPVRLTANKATSFTVSPMAQPVASSSADPYLSLGAAGENPSRNSLASAISGKTPSPPSSPSSTYKPMLNNNSFMLPNSTKVPLLQATEGLKPVSSPKIQLVSWRHSGGTGDCVLQRVEHKIPKSNGTVLGDGPACSPLSTPSSLDTSTTSVASPQYNQSDSAMRAEPHPCGLGGDSASQALTKEVRFTEAVRKLTARSFEKKPRQGCQFEQSCFTNPGLQWDLLNRNRQWKPPLVGQQFPQEDAGGDSRILPGASDTLELDGTVFCTKRISIHLLASHAHGLSRSPACGSVIGSPPRGEDKTPVLPSSPQPLGVADVATRLSSIQLGKEGPKEARELDSPARDIGSAADVQLDQVEAEDLEEDLVDGLEDCCSHDEDEEEEGDSECSSLSAVSPSESVAVISRDCTEILTKPLSSEKVVRPALIYSLFPNVPPTIYFGTRDERVEKLPWEQRKLLRWKMSTVTPNIVKQTIGRSHFKISKRNDDWLGCWGHHMKSPSFRSIREHQKVHSRLAGRIACGGTCPACRAALARRSSVSSPSPLSCRRMPSSCAKPGRAAAAKSGLLNHQRQLEALASRSFTSGVSSPSEGPFWYRGIYTNPTSSAAASLICESMFTSPPTILCGFTSFQMVSSALPVASMWHWYSPSMKSLGNKFMHLTNYSVNKKNTEYQANADETACQGHKWALKALWNYLSQKGVNSDAIWEKIKDVVVKTIISSEPYVTSLLKMYVRRPYSCHELFGFDIMLDENLKPWVLEVNISPSLHSNSPLDISIKGQMIRDLLNLAGFVLPNAEDIISSSSSSSSSTTSLSSSPRDKCRMAPEHFTAQKMKKAYYLTQKIPDQDFYASVLDVLTPDDVRVLVEMEDEFSRRGQFERIFPSRISSRYLRFFEQPRYFNILTTQWEQKYHGNKLKGVDLLRSWCYKGFHTGAVSDSVPLWSLPASLLTVPKGEVTPSAFSKSEPGKLGKHSSSEGSILLSEDETTKPKKTQAGLFLFPRKPSSSKDSEDTSKEPSLSTQMLPVTKCSGRTRLSASSASQLTGDSLLAAVSP